MANRPVRAALAPGNWRNTTGAGYGVPGGPAFMGFHVPHVTTGIAGSETGPQADWLRAAVSSAQRGPLWGLVAHGMQGNMHTWNFMSIFPLRPWQQG